MIEGGATWSTENTASIELPRLGISCNGNRTMRNQIRRDLVLVRREHGEVGNAGANILRRPITGLARYRRIGIRHFGVNARFGHDICERIGHQSAIATSIASLLTMVFHALVVAVHQVLLRQTRQTVIGKKPLPLNVSSGREGPATSALTLIFHGGDGTQRAPIKRIWNRGNFGWRNRAGDRPRGISFSVLETQVISLKLRLSEVSKLIYTKGGLRV